jgi:hypothetical protein
MKQLISIILLFTLTASVTYAQSADTVIIKVGEASQVVFQIGDKKDLQTLKQYDFQAVVNDLIVKLEQRDSTSLAKSSGDYMKMSAPAEVVATETTVSSSEENWGNTSTVRERRKSYYRKRTYHSINFDFGTNNYLADGKFPDESNSLYAVKPWGSWFVGANSIQRTRVARVFYLEWGGGVSWYNFKFQNTKTMMSKDDNSVLFAEDARDLDFKKSKLTACYLNFSFVPVIDFGSHRRKPMLFDSNHSESIRFGAGPYVGYRIDSYTKQVYREDGKQKERNHDSFYLDNVRYGVRFQFGFSDMDLFFNYDLNELFVANKGPKLNAFSFGITL